MTDAELAELLRSVMARPDDHELLRVYADVLIERGDPRGELVVVQLARAVDDTPELVAREAEIVRHLDARLSIELAQPNAVFQWRHGFLASAQLVSGDKVHAVKSLRTLGALPIARRLRRIVLHFDHSTWTSTGPVTDTLARMAPQWRELRELVFTDQRTKPPYTPIGDLAGVFRAAPRLDVLELSNVEWATLRDLSVLRTLRRLVATDAANRAIEAVSDCDLSHLEELVLRDGNWEARDFIRIRDRAFARLRRLQLSAQHAKVMRAVLGSLPEWRALATLRELSFAGAALDAECVRLLARAAPRFQQIERLEVPVEEPGLRAMFGARLVVG